eukprot:6483229-Lingulodinium_polyedra.AAC.1
MGQGVLQRNATKTLWSLLQPAQRAPEQGEAEAMKSAKARATALRGKGPNMLYVALLVLVRPAVYRRGLLAYSVLSDMAMYHGQHIKAC